MEESPFVTVFSESPPLCAAFITPWWCPLCFPIFTLVLQHQGLLQRPLRMLPTFVLFPVINLLFLSSLLSSIIIIIIKLLLLFWFFKVEFHYVALAVLELKSTDQTALELIEIHLPLSPECWD